jgi:hypothetical protein
MKYLFLFLFCLGVLSFSDNNVFAQSDSTKSEFLKDPNRVDVSKRDRKMNYLKLNLYSLAVQNISLQYERVINKPFSFALGFRFMPGGDLPFRNSITNLYDPATDSIAINTISNLKLNQYAITPELRWYVGKKGYGRGFYFAPFYRYTHFSTSEIGFDYTSDQNTNEQVRLKGSLTTQTLGLMLGAQWALAEHVSLDWWIIGPQFGTATGVFEGTTTLPLTLTEQADVRTNLVDAFGDFSSTNGMFSVSNTINVTDRGAKVTLKGPWSGIRAGLCLGIRF